MIHDSFWNHPLFQGFSFKMAGSDRAQKFLVRVTTLLFIMIPPLIQWMLKKTVCRILLRFFSTILGTGFRVGNFREKNNSTEDGIDGINKWLFPTEFQLFCGTENLGIPFRTLLRKRKQLGIPFRGPKIEINSHNSVPKPFCGRDHNSEFRS
jgi:hypothetical protein